MIKEEWRPIKGYEGLYEVSNWGRVKSLKYGKERILKPGLGGGMYLIVHLCNNKKIKCYYVHRLVAQAFPEICGEWFEGCVINHKDECKTNNIATNLETCTQSYNVNYAGAQERRVELYIKKRSKKVLQFTKDGTFIREWKSPAEAARGLNLIYCNFVRVLKRNLRYTLASDFNLKYA